VVLRFCHQAGCGLHPRNLHSLECGLVYCCALWRLSKSSKVTTSDPRGSTLSVTSVTLRLDLHDVKGDGPDIKLNKARFRWIANSPRTESGGIFVRASVNLLIFQEILRKLFVRLAPPQ